MGAAVHVWVTLPDCCWLLGGVCSGRCLLLSPCVQVSNAARSPSTSWLAGPPASWLDDFLSWISPSLPQCCRAFPPKDPAGLESEPCPPPDQPPCTSQGSPCANCSVCFAAGHHPAPGVLVDGRPSLDQVTCCISAHPLHIATSCKAFLQELRPMVLLLDVCTCPPAPWSGGSVDGSSCLRHHPPRSVSAPHLRCR